MPAAATTPGSSDLALNSFWMMKASPIEARNDVELAGSALGSASIHLAEVLMSRWDEKAGLGGQTAGCKAGTFSFLPWEPRPQSCRAQGKVEMGAPLFTKLWESPDVRAECCTQTRRYRFLSVLYLWHWSFCLGIFAHVILLGHAIRTVKTAFRYWTWTSHSFYLSFLPALCLISPQHAVIMSHADVKCSPEPQAHHQPLTLSSDRAGLEPGSFCNQLCLPSPALPSRKSVSQARPSPNSLAQCFFFNTSIHLGYVCQMFL